MNGIYSTIHVPEHLQKGDISEIFVVDHSDLHDFGKDFKIDSNFKPVPGIIPTMRNLLVQQETLTEIAMEHQANLALVDGDNVNYMRCQEKKKAGREYPGVGIGAIVMDNKDRYLLTRRGPLAGNRVGQWENPGGTQEKGQSLFETAEREVQEETSYIVTAMAIVSFCEEFVDGQHWNNFGILCHWNGERDENHIPEEGKIDKIDWFDYDNLPNPFSQGSLAIINDHLRADYSFQSRRITE